MKKALVLCAFLLLCVLLLPRHALAAPFSHGDVVSLRHDGLGEGSFVKMKLPNTEIPSTLWAGEHRLLIEGDLYIGFCVDDVMADLINTLPYTLASVSSFSDGYRFAAGIAGAYFNHYPNLPPSMELNATQAQVLIWETALETAEKYDAATGDVAVRDEALAAQINAISYLDWINAAPGHFLASIDTTGWFVAQSDLSQDFLVYQPPVSVPEPATMLLLGVGLLGLAGFGRNTKRR